MDYDYNSDIDRWFEQRKAEMKEDLSTALEEDISDKDVVELMLELLESAKLRKSMVDFYKKN